MPRQLKRFRSAPVACAAFLAAVGALAACKYEKREFRESPPSGPPTGVVRVSALQPGPTVDSVHVRNVDDQRAYDVSEGQRLFSWYNCVGCHSHGGGGMGPPLMDSLWIYGSAPENIYESIVQGRPNGMPSFGTRIPSEQVWQLVAYVRSLSGLTPSPTRSARPDHMMYQPGSQSLQKPEKPKNSSMPPAAEMP